MARDRFRQRGVTLPEVMVVVGTLVVLSGMASSNLRGLVLLNRERTAAATVLEHLNEARSLARSLLQPVTVTVDAEALTIAPEGREPRVYPVDPLLSGLAIDSPDGTLRFTPSGGLEQRDPTTLTVSTHRGQVYTFTVFPAIGAIRSGS